jgi:acetylornithine deacetylase/succinyl-diaminopimelate desuccinylase-like protein
MSNITEKFDSFLEAQLDNYIEELSDLCCQPSISAQNIGIRETAEMVKGMLEKRGLDVTIYETGGNPVVVGRGKGKSERTLMFYNHYDVQPPEPLELWTTPAFEPTLRDGKLYARGVGDDKGEFVSRLAAFDAVKVANNGELPCNVIFVVEGEEEIGSPNIEPFLKAHAHELACEGCIWEFGGTDELGNPSGYLGMRGLLGIELHVRTMQLDAHSGGAHALPNAAWRLVRVLSSLKDEEEQILIPGFYENIVPMTDLDRELFSKLPNTEAQEKARYKIDSFLNGMSGQELHEAVFNPTCNIEGITTGYQGGGIKTVIPSAASVKIDFRLVPGQVDDDLIEKLRKHLDSQGFEDVEIRKISSIAPYKASGDNPFIQLVRETALDAHGKEMLINPLVGGSGPIAAFGTILNTAIGFAGINYPDTRAHAPDENIVIENFLLGAKHNARILQGFGGL